MKVTIRKAVNKTLSNQIPDLIQRAINWMQEKYPDVSFDLDFIFGTGCRARYFRNEVHNGSYMN